MTTWAFNGIDLSTYGIVTLIDDDLDTAAKRGEDLLVPFQDGRKFRPKFFDSRSLIFGIAMKTATAAALETLIDHLKLNLISPRGQKYLVQTREDASTRRALASIERDYQLKRESHNFAQLVLDFELADPYFRSPTLIADNTLVINASPKTMEVTNPGTAEESNPTILLTGPLTNVLIVHPLLGTSLLYTGVIAGGAYVTIGTLNSRYYATHSSLGNVMGNVTHPGDSALLRLSPGTDPNELTITSDVYTTGSVKVSFYPPYL
jgi:hypothetical protein